MKTAICITILTLFSNTIYSYDSQVLPAYVNCTEEENAFRIRYGFYNEDRHIIIEYTNGSKAISKSQDDFYSLPKLCPDVLGDKSHRKGIELLKLKAQVQHLTLEAFEYCENIKVIILSDNLIQAIFRGTFVGLPRLTNIDLQNNRISYLDYGSFAYSPKVDTINLDFNNLKILRSGSFAESRVNLISLRSCNIVDIEEQAFILMEKLRLDLSYNHFTYFNAMWFQKTKLEAIYTSDVYLYSIPKDSFSGQIMTTLRIHNSKIHFIHGKAFDRSKVATLDFSYNKISDYTFAKEMTEVTTLNLQHNVIRELVPFILDKTRMQFLNMNHNKLKVIDENVFPTSLKSLSLAYNKIYYVDELAFIGLSKLEILDLSYNLITQIKREWFFGHPIKRFFAIGNQIRSVLPKQFRYLNVSQVEIVDLSKNKLANVQENALEEGPAEYLYFNANNNELLELDPNLFTKHRIDNFYLINSYKIKESQPMKYLARTDFIKQIFISTTDLTSEEADMLRSDLYNKYVTFEDGQLFDIERLRNKNLLQ